MTQDGYKLPPIGTTKLIGGVLHRVVQCGNCGELMWLDARTATFPANDKNRFFAVKCDECDARRPLLRPGSPVPDMPTSERAYNGYQP